MTKQTGYTSGPLVWLTLVALLSATLPQLLKSQSSIGLLSSTYTCENAHYVPRTVSYDPLIVHIEGFITPNERKYLAAKARQNLARSMIASPNGGPPRVVSGRTSSTSFIPKADSVATCIRNRAASFQGFPALSRVESLQVVQYETGQQYVPHFDWTRNTTANPQRDTTFFGILEADCDNCGTQFPEIAIEWSGEDPRWCEFVECGNEQNLTFKAVPGSAVFWRNLHEDGTGDVRNRHAGLPVRSGTKLGLNIWTRV